MRRRPREKHNPLCHRCDRNWKEECRAIQKKWNDSSIKDDYPRGGDCFKINIGVSNGINKIVWRNDILKHLKIDAACPTNIKAIRAAR